MYENRKKQGDQGGSRNNDNRNKGPQNNQQQGQNKYNNNKRKGSNQGNRNARQQTLRSTSVTNPTCAKCGKNHLGECRQGTTVCYKYGKEGHYARGYTVKTSGDDWQNRN